MFPIIILLEISYILLGNIFHMNRYIYLYALTFLSKTLCRFDQNVKAFW